MQFRVQGIAYSKQEVQVLDGHTRAPVRHITVQTRSTNRTVFGEKDRSGDDGGGVRRFAVDCKRDPPLSLLSLFLLLLLLLYLLYYSKSASGSPNPEANQAVDRQ